MLIGYGTVSAGSTDWDFDCADDQDVKPASFDTCVETNRRGFHFDVSERRRATGPNAGQSDSRYAPMATGEEITNGYHRRQTYPRKNAAYRLTSLFSTRTAILSPGYRLDSEVSIDGARLPLHQRGRRKSPPSGMYLSLRLDRRRNERRHTICRHCQTSSSRKKRPSGAFACARSVNDLAYPTVSGRSLMSPAGGGD